MSDPRSTEADRVAAYTTRHDSVRKEPPKPPPKVPPPDRRPQIVERARARGKGVVRRVRATPKNVYRFFRKNTPRRLKSSAALWPARFALGLYRRHLKKPQPEVPLPVCPWRGGTPNHDRATAWRLEASARHAYSGTASVQAATKRVAALVLNRNGAHHLEKLFESILEHEDYPALSMWVIDHGSSDESREVLRAFADRLDLHTVLVDENRSFSESNNDLARRVDADLLLLLNNDIIFDRPVLRHLVTHLDDPAVGAVGLRLDFPAQHEHYPGGIQHAGIKFYADAETTFYRPYNLSARTGLAESGRGAERMPATTAAFLLCRKEDYLDLGGLDEAFVYGYEDVDFCLRLRQDLGLHTIVVHDTSAIHDESSTQNRDPSEELRARRERNRDVFESRWGYALRHAIIQDRLNNHRWLTDPPLRVGFAVTEAGPNARAGDYFTAKELSEAMETELGAETAMLPASGDWYDVRGLDVLIAMVDRYDARRVHERQPGSLLIAWARNWFDRWGEREGFSSFDMCFVSSDLAARFMMEKHHRRADVLRLATHPTRFAEGRYDARVAADVCFTGSHWGAHREIEDNLRPTEIEGTVAIWGAGWAEHRKLGRWARGFLPYDRIADVYASSKIVIDDANHVTKPWASTNSRVFDALAAGALVVTNGVLGAREVFGEDLPTYEGPRDLTRILNEALRDEEARRARVATLRQRVLSAHTYRHRAQQIGELVREVSEGRLRIAIKIAAPKHETKQRWGDYHFALALRRCFERLGHLVRIDLLYEWYDPPTLSDDVVLVLRGLSRYEPNPRHVNLMWNISHPDEVEDEEYEGYDHVFVASVSAARELSRLRVPVSPLLQCTDPSLFKPAADTNAPCEEVLFVGNSRRQYRPIVMDAIAAGLPLAIYGGGWENLVPGRYIRGAHIENTELHAYYRAAGVVLNDHWADMRMTGFLSNRLFDAAASGAILISDPAVGMTEVFGDAIRTYTTVAELAEMVNGLLADPEQARRRALALSDRVRAEHSFERRAEVILEAARRLCDARPRLRT